MARENKMPFGFESRKLMLSSFLLASLLATVSVATAATLDPLLRGLTAEKSDHPGLMPEKYLAMDLTRNPQDPTVGVILHLDGGRFDADLIPHLVVGSRRGRFVTARLPLSSLVYLEENNQVAHVEAARLLHPTMDLAVVDGQVDDVWAGAPAYTGAGVLVGVIDSGIDWNHADFKTAGGDSRILYIWDQYGLESSVSPPPGFAYGDEYNQVLINAGSVAQEDLSGHGSHVAGIAAGNGLTLAGQYSGVAPEADILFVKAFNDNIGGFPEDKTIDAMNYLADKAESLGQPMAVNMSLGGHMGPHDGTSAQEQLIDELSGSGLVFCIAAGNEGEAQLHHSGPAANTDFALTIDPYTPNGGSENDYLILNLWVEGAGNPSVTVSRSGTSVGPIASGSSGGEHTSYGTVVIDNATGGADPNNGDKQMIIQIDDRSGTVPASGDWEISVSAGTGTVDAWVATSTMTVYFPDSDQSSSVGMPGTSEAAITVAAHKTRQNWESLGGNVQYHPETSWGLAEVGDHAPFSSIGPTRDGREKPDLSAPGQGIFAPYSADTYHYPGDAFLNPSGDYLLSQGTSMASPFVCGVAALLLEKNGTLNATQIKNVLRLTASTDEYTGAVWNARFGAGKVDALAAIQVVGLPAPPPVGDVDDDGSTTVLDVVRLMNYIVDPSGHPLDSEARAEGDVYPAPAGDGLLNASDLARIIDFILESDEPGYAAPSAEPVRFEIADPVWQDGRWWQPINIDGTGVVAGQFALSLDGAVWNPDDLVCEAAAQVVAKVAGSQLRVIVLDADGSLSASGLSLRVPFQFDGDEPGLARTHGLLMAAQGGHPLQVQESAPLSQGFLRASPNPARGDMTVSFSRVQGKEYELSVFDMRGRQVRRFRGGGGDSPGQWVFDGRDNSGRRLPAGIYLLRYSSGNQRLTQKIVYTR